jgi:tyrosyl-tRNA synthetase
LPPSTLSPEAQLEILVRGTEEVLPEGALLDRLRRRHGEGRPLRVKQGFDPTAPDIHLGHTVGLRKLRQFQDLGHQVVLIVGDYTGMVGDPSGRNRTRPQLSAQEVDRNATTYLEQFYRVLERTPAAPRLPVEVHRNGEWFAEMRFIDVIRLASKSTVARMLERDDFAKRHAANLPIGIHELFYPLMQGHDSVAIHADVELGGTEQKFNLLVGRAMQEDSGQPPQIVMTLPVLPGTDGKERMSKSLGNYIGVSEPASEIYGKTMSLPDRVMMLFWQLVTDAGPEELREVEAVLADPSVNPMKVKKRLAHRLVAMYHGAEAADRAQAGFERQFSRREVPEDLPVWRAESANPMGIKDLLVAIGLATSGNDAWRAVDQGSVAVDGSRITERTHKQPLDREIVVRRGRRMVRVVPAGGR